MQTTGKTLSCQELEYIAEELQRANYYPGGDYKIPEKALLAAVLQRAIVDLLRPLPQVDNPLERKRIRCWFLSRGRDPFSFLWICEELDLNPALLIQRFSSRLLEK